MRDVTITVLDHYRTPIISMQMLEVGNVEIEKQLLQLEQMFPYFEIEVEDE